jgi:hypothetical protein
MYIHIVHDSVAHAVHATAPEDEPKLPFRSVVSY